MGVNRQFSKIHGTNEKRCVRELLRVSLRVRRDVILLLPRGTNGTNTSVEMPVTADRPWKLSILSKFISMVEKQNGDCYTLRDRGTFFVRNLLINLCLLLILQVLGECCVCSFVFNYIENVHVTSVMLRWTDQRFMYSSK